MKTLRAILDKFYEKPLIGSMVLSGGFMLCLLCFFTSTFETNDDAYMMMFASGFYLGSPIEYILPAGVFLGTFLKFLYIHFPQGNWYVWGLFAIHFVSIWILLYLVFASRKHLYLLLATLASILLFESYFLVFLQFTTTAFLLSISAFLLFFYTTSQLEFKFYHCILPIFLLIIASQIRDKVPGFTLAVGIPALAYLAFFKKKFWAVLGFGVLFLGFFFTSVWLENNYQGKITNWGSHRHLFEKGFYSVYNKPMLDYEKDPAFYSNLGWSKNDYLMLKNGFFEDLPKYSMENLEKIARLNKNQKIPLLSVYYVIELILWKFRYITFFTAFALLMLFLQKNNSLSLVSIGMVVVALGFCFYIGSELFLKARVIVPLLCFIQLFALVSMSENQWRSGIGQLKWFRISLHAFLAFTIIFGFIKLVKNDRENIKPMVQQFENHYIDLEKSFPDQVMVTWGLGFTVDRVNVLSNFYVNKTKARLYLVLANLGYWHNPELLKVHRETNVYLALIQNPKFLLLLSEDKKLALKDLNKYYEENYHVSIKNQLVRTFFDQVTGRPAFSVYRISQDVQ